MQLFSSIAVLPEIVFLPGLFAEKKIMLQHQFFNFFYRNTKCLMKKREKPGRGTEAMVPSVEVDQTQKEN